MQQRAKMSGFQRPSPRIKIKRHTHRRIRHDCTAGTHKRAENCSTKTTYTFRKKRPTKRWSLRLHQHKKQTIHRDTNKYTRGHPKADSRFIGEKGFSDSFKISAGKNPPTTTKLPTCFPNEASRHIVDPSLMGLRLCSVCDTLCRPFLELSPLPFFPRGMFLWIRDRNLYDGLQKHFAIDHKFGLFHLQAL